MTDTIWRAALELAQPEIRGKTIRLLGVGASNFGERQQLGLFGGGDDRLRRAVEAADAVKRRFGPRAITRARLLGSHVAEPFERDPMTAPEARRVGRPRPAAESEDGH
jgi:hypothetical protein